MGLLTDRAWAISDSFVCFWDMFLHTRLLHLALTQREVPRLTAIWYVMFGWYPWEACIFQKRNKGGRVNWGEKDRWGRNWTERMEKKLLLGCRKQEWIWWTIKGFLERRIIDSWNGTWELGSKTGSSVVRGGPRRSAATGHCLRLIWIFWVEAWGWAGQSSWLTVNYLWWFD